MSTPLTLQQIQAVKTMEQLNYEIGLARVRDVESFQDDEGRPVFYAKVEMGSSVITILGEREEISKLEPFKGKFVSIAGQLDTELKKTGLKVRFSVSEVKEVK